MEGIHSWEITILPVVSLTLQYDTAWARVAKRDAMNPTLNVHTNCAAAARKVLNNFFAKCSAFLPVAQRLPTALVPDAFWDGDMQELARQALQAPGARRERFLNTLPEHRLRKSSSKMHDAAEFGTARHFEGGAEKEPRPGCDGLKLKRKEKAKKTAKEEKTQVWPKLRQAAVNFNCSVVYAGV